MRSLCSNGAPHDHVACNRYIGGGMRSKISVSTDSSSVSFREEKDGSVEGLCLPRADLVFSSVVSGCDTQTSEDMASEETAASLPQEEADVPDVFWEEVSESGVDEKLLVDNTDRETLEYVARKLQGLCSAISEKGERDKEYWLTGQWYDDAMGSEEYHDVVSLGEAAMKPLFLIVYKSERAGLYEWVCSKALEEISGYDFSDANNGNGWKDANEFLEMFIERINEQKNSGEND